jgi:stalled ribosome alternative rescue factor ArfA
MKKTAKQLVLQPRFRPQVEAAKKGKRGYTRKAKHLKPVVIPEEPT